MKLRENILVCLILVLPSSFLYWREEGVLASSYGNPSAYLSDQQMIKLPLRGIVDVHPKAEGWAELPSIALMSRHVYVAYNVREDNSSRLYLSKIKSDLSGSVERIKISNDDEIAFQPSLAVWNGRIWIGWTSVRDAKWEVRICDFNGSRLGKTRAISGGDAFVSQLRIKAGKNELGCVWSSWEGTLFSIQACFLRSKQSERLTIYRSENPVGRPEICPLGDGTWLFLWDEFTDQGYVIRGRMLAKGKLDSVQTISNSDGWNDWEPRASSGKGKTLVVWTSVPPGSGSIDLGMCIPGSFRVQGGLGRIDDREVWRVTTAMDDDGSCWLAWLTRYGYRSTRLFLRQVERTGISQVCEIEFPSFGTFVNWFDIDMGKSPLLAWEEGGSICVARLDRPGVCLGPLPEVSQERAVSDERPSKPGRYAIEYAGETLSVYFGDYHNHSCFSDGRAYPDISANLARHFRNLDFFGITDHDVSLTPGEFMWTKAVASNLTRYGEFVFLVGYEPSKGWAQNDFGHWNMIYFNGGEVFQFKEGMTPLDLYGYAKQKGGILIPHHIGAKFAPHNWEYHDEVAEPVVEVCSIHGIFDTYEGKEDDPSIVKGRLIEDGLARGYKFGLVGGSDSHNCFDAVYKEYGLTGIYAKSLDPEGVRDALTKRRTFAFTGGWVVLDFRCNGYLMGEVLTSSDDLVLTCYASSPDSIAEVNIIANGESIYRYQSSQPEVRFTYVVPSSNRPAYYYLKVKTRKGDLAWSSPIWIEPTR